MEQWTIFVSPSGKYIAAAASGRLMLTQTETFVLQTALQEPPNDCVGLGHERPTA